MQYYCELGLEHCADMRKKWIPRRFPGKYQINSYCIIIIMEKLVSYTETYLLLVWNFIMQIYWFKFISEVIESDDVITLFILYRIV